MGGVGTSPGATRKSRKVDIRKEKENRLFDDLLTKRSFCNGIAMKNIRESAVDNKGRRTESLEEGNIGFAELVDAYLGLDTKDLVVNKDEGRFPIVLILKGLKFVLWIKEGETTATANTL